MPNEPAVPPSPDQQENSPQITGGSQGQTTAQEASFADSILTPAPPETSEQITGIGPFSKKRFPKLAIFLLIAVFLLGALAFLVSKLTSSDKGLVGKKGEIVWWGLQEDETAITPLIEEYQAKNPKVKITYIKQSTQDYRERLTNSLAGGTGPDIFEIHNSWPPMFRSDLAAMESSAMSKEEFARTFYPVIASDLTTEDGVIGIPLFFDAITLYINEDIFASAAKSPPKTWNELKPLAVGLTPPKDAKGAIIQSGVALGRTENVDHWPDILGLMMFQNKVNLAKPTGKLSEDAVQFFTFFSDEAGVWDEKLPSSTIAFAQGKVAMYFGPSRRASEIVKTNPNLRFKTVPLPQLAKETPGEPDVSYATYWAEAVWKRSVNKDAAWDFLKFLTSRDSLERLNNESKRAKTFERPYPRMDMASLQSDDSIVGSVIALAPYARSWYLASDTSDGPTGLNSQMDALFARALKPGANPKGELEETAKGVSKLLSLYSIVVK